MSKSDIIQQIFSLCESLKHDDAIKLTNNIENKSIAIKAHLLCIEHEMMCRNTGRLPKELQ